MQKWDQFMEQFWYVLPLSAWALIGCLARALNAEWQGWKSFLAAIATSFAAASIVGLLLDGAGLSENVLCGISGCIGWGGGRIMEDLIRWGRRRAERAIAGDAEEEDCPGKAGRD